ncbi:hypothetical protein ILYODFUR_038699 [Ilyodon furcidens]|uniref:Uncharacterized protein n=1 Tax=Ilyodon furcidens TaxID=33524 RepID=A0ABV0TQT6_9TELE
MRNKTVRLLGADLFKAHQLITSSAQYGEDIWHLLHGLSSTATNQTVSLTSDSSSYRNTNKFLLGFITVVAALNLTVNFLLLFHLIQVKELFIFSYLKRIHPDYLKSL